MTFQDERQNSPPRIQHGRDGLQPYRRPNQRQNRRGRDSDIENQLPQELMNNPLLQNEGRGGFNRNNENNRNNRHWDQHDHRGNHYNGHDNRGSGFQGRRPENQNRHDNYNDRRSGQFHRNSHSDYTDLRESLTDRRSVNRSNSYSENYESRGNYSTNQRNGQRNDYDRRDNYRDIREQYRKHDNSREGNSRNDQGHRDSRNYENNASTYQRGDSREDSYEVSLYIALVS